MNLGLYGGTFDPIHHGHLILGRDAIEELKLDRLIFVPATISPHKLHRTAAPPELRLEMARAAVADEPRFDVDDLELRRPAPSFTIDTVLEMKRRHPDAALFYLIGEDNVAELHTWRRIGELTKLAQFVVLNRTDGRAAHPFPTLARRIDVSATEIRRRVANGESIRYLVPERVWKIIQQNNLYAEEGN
jgi:nicotinate-nucleotide adenylyltransferase